jgi:hypothetical protein
LIWWWGIYLFFIYYILLWWWGIYFFHFIRFCSDGGVFICMSFY